MKLMHYLKVKAAWKVSIVLTAASLALWLAHVTQRPTDTINTKPPIPRGANLANPWIHLCIGFTAPKCAASIPAIAKDTAAWTDVVVAAYGQLPEGGEISVTSMEETCMRDKCYWEIDIKPSAINPRIVPPEEL